MLSTMSELIFIRELFFLLLNLIIIHILTEEWNSQTSEMCCFFFHVQRILQPASSHVWCKKTLQQTLYAMLM